MERRGRATLRREASWKVFPSKKTCNRQHMILPSFTITLTILPAVRLFQSLQEARLKFVVAKNRMSLKHQHRP